MHKVIKHIFAWFMLLFGAASLLGIGVKSSQALAVFMVVFYLIYFGIINLKEERHEDSKKEKARQD